MADTSRILYIGSSLATLVEGVDHSIEIDDSGVGSAVLEYTCKYDDAIRLVRALKVHPEFSWLMRKKATIRRIEGYLATVSVNFEGVDPEPSPGSNGPGMPEQATGEDGELVTYTLEGATDSEPIETHPDFPEFAGKPADPATWKNGAEFDKKTGEFLGFRPLISGAPNPKAGIKSYYSPGLVYTRVRTIPDRTKITQGINLASLGKIDTPPASYLLPNVGTRTWLKSTARMETVGNGLRLHESWKLSGRAGWDADIY
jgi:hypothetical protein